MIPLFKKGLSAFLFFIFTFSIVHAQSIKNRWRIEPNGSIYWKIEGSKLPHSDHIEMSGQQISLWLKYTVDTAKQLTMSRTLVFPSFRMKPNDTHASLMYSFGDDDLPRFFIDGKPLAADIINGRHFSNFPQKTTGIYHKGIMGIDSKLKKEESLTLKRYLYPSVDKPLAIETFVFVNIDTKPVKLEMEYAYRESKTDTSRSVNGPYRVICQTINDGIKWIKQGDSVSFSVSYQAARNESQTVKVNVNNEEQARRKRIAEFASLLQLQTPDTLLNTAFAFAKIRATESIFATKGGLMHAPGGLSYYAAIWANDQAEYVNPFFAMLGDSLACQSAINAYRLFAGYMNPSYKPIPSSIVAEGDGYWNGAGDRGDQAMIAYGAARFALAYGKKETAQQLWPLIEWCLEFCHRKLNAEGVITSDSDELEGRFPAGKANLCTSTLYYDALLSAAMLSTSLNLDKKIALNYQDNAQKLRTAIENYFGANVEGFNTYRYYKENDILRSWICMPLTVNILDRKKETIDALLSSRLWTADGLATQAGDKTFWDRSTLYALRGMLAAGETEKSMAYLRYYSQRRLLGEHVPYPVEAFPEGNQRHLSAESGLYCRVFTEGLFGIRPTGLSQFILTPHLPNDWPYMSLKNIHAFNQVFDLTVKRKKGDLLLLEIKQGGKNKIYTIQNGKSLSLKF
ncbi:hypothetical protein NF867_14020 [Solitalea sp. MAHUQ-68]|uniref:Uncharacterized protein n=1 Tax=Solitalea agri TaxID=2953739 RepID=A0A9X2JDC2_9SPHI|nr:hypothetical protein [Solitalea agri]MCO4293978.1 hypothetical protein [Solitalea agri]